MPFFLKDQTLSRSDLPLFLRNDLGQAQDGYDVRWTIFKKTGEPSSGSRLPAIKADVGEYFAPWGCNHSGGCYTVKWEFRAEPSGPIQHRCQDFFVLDISNYCPCPISCQSSVDCGAFFSGQPLGPNDLRIKITDDDGLPVSAYAVFWTIYDRCGKAVTLRTTASPGSSLGEYYASWVACGFGEYSVLWEWMLESDSPIEAVRNSFSILNPPALFFSAGICCLIRTPSCCSHSPCGPSASCSAGAPSVKTPPNFCAGCPPLCSVPTQQVIVQQCCDVEVPRIVHLASQVLPAGGAFTNQVPYAIPARVRKVAFYVTYTRGAAGGFAVIRLLWGNGVEETQTTVISNTAVPVINGQLIAQAMRHSDLMGPIPDTDSPISFMLETTAPGGSSSVRLLAAEGGVIGLPGIISITLTASSD